MSYVAYFVVASFPVCLYVAVDDYLVERRRRNDARHMRMLDACSRAESGRAGL